MNNKKVINDSKTGMLDKSTKIIDLTIGYMENPLGISTDDISFSWKMKSKLVGQSQKAYEIVVSKKDGTQVWKSGKVDGEKSIGIKYDGNKLDTSTRYNWNVNVWASDGNSYTSDTMFFETGVTGETAWEETPFISLNTATDIAPIFRTEQSLNSNKVKQARLYITSIGVYKAYINGTVVGEEDHMTPGYGDGSRSIAYQTYDVTDMLSDKESAAITVMVGTGWSNSQGSDVMGSTTNKVAVKALMIIEYEDGSKQNITTDIENWRVSLSGPVTASGIFYGEDYDAEKENALGDYKQAGYTYNDLWINSDDINNMYLTTIDYVGEIIEDPASTGKIVNEFSKDAVSAVTYSKNKENSEYEGGEIEVDNEYNKENGKDIFENGITLKSGQTMVINMGQNMTAIPYVKMQGTKGEKVTIRFGEMLNDGSRVTPNFVSGSHDASGPKGTLYTHSLRTARASVCYTFYSNEIEEYQTMMSFFGYQFIEITATTDIKIYNITSKAVSSLTEQAGFIETNNSAVNQLFSNVLYGQLSNYFTMITDCPQRDERKGWTGDAQVFAQSGLYNFNTMTFQNSYQNKLSASTNEKGYPSAVLSLWDFFGNWASGWSDVEITNVWTMYKQTGDISIIKNNWEAINSYMEYLKKHERSKYMAPKQDSTGYGDWLAFQGTGYEVIADYYYGYVTMLMRDMAEIIEDNSNKTYYSDYFENLKTTFLSTHVVYDKEATDKLIIKSGKGTMVMQNKGGVNEDNSQTSLLWMLKLGYYTDDDMRDEAIKLLIENIKNENPSESSIRSKYGKNSLSVGFLGVNVIAPVLSEIGYSDVAYDLLLNTECPSWLFEVKQGATTIWERWNSYSIEEGFGDCEMNSFNHFSYGAIVEWMYRYMAGISADDTNKNNAGFHHIILQPTIDRGIKYNEEARINRVSASYESYYGTIVSNWAAEDGILKSYHVEIPANTTATVYLPVKELDDINSLEAVKYIGTTKHNGETVCEFEIVSGGYDFVVKDGKVTVNVMDN